MVFATTEVAMPAIVLIVLLILVFLLVTIFAV